MVAAYCGAAEPTAQEPSEQVKSNPAHPTQLRELEGFLPAEHPYHSELITRVDELHKVGYEKWINTAWAAMLTKQGIIGPEEAPKVAESLLAVWRPTLSGHRLTATVPLMVADAVMWEISG
jgi:hypothetical protein